MKGKEYYYYALDLKRGGIDERWFSSAIKDNAAYEIICLQGNGTFGRNKTAPSVIRYL